MQSYCVAHAGTEIEFANSLCITRANSRNLPDPICPRRSGCAAEVMTDEETLSLTLGT